MGWLIAERAFRVALGFIILAWTARYLGTDGFGTLNYATALIAIFATLAQLGLGSFIIRDTVIDPEKKYEVLGTACLLRLVSGIISFMGIICTIVLLNPDNPLRRTIVIIMSVSLLFQNFNVIDSWFQSQVQSRYSVWARNTAFFTMSLLRIYLLQSKAPLITFALALLIEDFISNSISIFLYQKSGEKIQKWRFNFVRAKKLLQVSWPLIFSNLSVMVYIYVDQVILGQMSDAETVGIYAAAVKLSENWTFLVLAMTSSVTPYILEGKKISEEVYYKRLQKICNFLALIFYLIAIPLTFLSTPLVVLVFGEKFIGAGVILSIHIWSSIWYFFGNIKITWIVAEELTGFALAASFCGAVMNVLLNIWLIPICQAVGSAIATVISYGFADYVMCLIYPPARKFAWIMTKALALNIFVTINQKY